MAAGQDMTRADTEKALHLEMPEAVTAERPADMAPGEIAELLRDLEARSLSAWNWAREARWDEGEHTRRLGEAARADSVLRDALFLTIESGIRDPGEEVSAFSERIAREEGRKTEPGPSGPSPAEGSVPGGIFADAFAAVGRRAARQDQEAARWVRGGREQQELRDAKRAGAETADQVVRAQLDAGMSPDAVDRSAEQVLAGRFDNPTPVSDALFGGYDEVAATHVADARRDIEAG